MTLNGVWGAFVFLRVTAGEQIVLGSVDTGLLRGNNLCLCAISAASFCPAAAVKSASTGHPMQPEEKRAKLK